MAGFEGSISAQEWLVLKRPVIPSNQSLSDQLRNEWVEFANTSGAQFNLEHVVLVHFTFDRACGSTGQEVVTSFTGALETDQSLRVHTGAGEASNEGTLRHIYLNRGNFTWNNNCGDSVLLLSNITIVDFSRYEPRAGEGEILNRVSGQNLLR